MAHDEHALPGNQVGLPDLPPLLLRVAVCHQRTAEPPDEGHDILGTTNRAAFVREVVQWLIRHLLDVDERSA